MENYQIRSKVHPKQRVAVLLKEDYENGNLTYGTVDEILTKTDTHYRGIKVRIKPENETEEEMKKLDKKLNYMTVPAAIKELEKIEMVRQLDNIYRLDHAVTANQKVILKAFGLDANSIKYFASELSKELKEAE